jgi:hypothetical protein
MRFDVDAFISYAHLDNLQLVEGDKGWVADLHQALERRLAMFLGKAPYIFRDPKLQGNDALTETLIDQLKRAASLVAVVSPPYVNSQWTRKELDEFCKAAKEQGGLLVRHKARIFKVLKAPVPLSFQTPELQELLGYDFFKIDPDTGHVRELNKVFGETAQREFWMKLDDLAQEMCALLKELEASAAGKPLPLQAARGTVFLAETTSDLREQRETIRRDLQQHGYLVLPVSPLPTVAADVKASLRADLARCQLSIHLFGRNYGLVPEGGVQSLLELQNEAAIERAAAGDFCRLLWIRPDLNVVDERQRRVVEQLRNDPRLERGADLLETFLEDLRTLIRLRLDPPRTPPPLSTPLRADAPRLSPSSAREVRNVYLIHDQRDASLIRPWGDCLFGQQLEVLLPAFEGDEAEVRAYHEENLRICDGALVFYGAANEMWVRRKLRDLRKIAGYGRTKPAPPVAVCVLPPFTPEKEQFRTHEALVIRGAAEFTPQPLAPFVSSVTVVEERAG